MTKKISLTSKAISTLVIIAVIGICSCNNNATTEETKTDSPMMAPAAVDTLPKVMDSMPPTPIDTGRDTKVPRN